MSAGTINVARSLWDDPAFADEPFSEREAWVWILAEASWKARTRRVGSAVVTTERGQLAASVRFMAERFGWSKSRVHRFLGRLENRDMIGTDSGTGCLVITICKYDDYQGQRDSIGTPPYREAGQHRDSSGTNEKKGERRGKEGKEEACASSPAIPANDISHAVTRYNAAAAKAGWPQVQKIGPNRSKLLRARLAECGGVEGWEVALRKAFDSDFCRGRTAKPWAGFAFDWLVKSGNFTKLMEGNYDNRTGNGDADARSENRPDPALEQIARLAGLV